MNAISLIAVYSLVVVLAAVFGSRMPARFRLNHTRIQLVMSLVSGLMLGVAIFHLMPHGIQEMGGAGHVDDAMISLMAGLIIMFLMLRWFHFHQHDASILDHNHDHPLDDCAHSVSHDHDHKNVNRWAWLAVFGGLAIHTMIDGVALGAAIKADMVSGEIMGFAGIGVFLAIVLHKPLDALTIASLMQRSAWSVPAQTAAVILFVLMLPLGALLFQVVTLWMGEHHSWVGVVLMFSAGVFMCISLSDLLPELHFHSHDRFKLTMMLIAGISAAYLITLIEPSYHGH